MTWIYRGEDRTPEKLAELGSMATYAVKSLLQVRYEVAAAIKKDKGISYCKDHRHARFNFALSCGTDSSCDGYAGARKYTYAMKFDNLQILDLNTNQKLLRFPARITEKQVLLCTDRLGLGASSVIGLGIPNSKEVVILMNAPLRNITHYREGTAGAWLKLDWAQLKAKSALPSIGGRKALFEQLSKRM